MSRIVGSAEELGRFIPVADVGQVSSRIVKVMRTTIIGNIVANLDFGRITRDLIQKEGEDSHCCPNDGNDVCSSHSGADVA